MITTVSTDSVAMPGSDVAWTTYQLGLTLSGSANNLFAIYGDAVSPMVLPPAYQDTAGADIGGVSSDMVSSSGRWVNGAFIAGTAAFDSWLTVGIADGDSGGWLNSVGIDWQSWTASAELRTTGS